MKKMVSFIINKVTALLCLLLISTIFLAGCKEDAPAPTEQIEVSGQRLHITGTVTEDSGRKEYAVPDTDRGVSVFYFDDTTIRVNGREVPLQDAVEQGNLMPEEIAAYARLDALDGYCKMDVVSEKGLTTFSYVYVGQFALRVVNDVLETPDGKQHHIETVEIYAPNRSFTSVAYYGEDGQPLDQEDWGLSFTVEDATTTGATLVCTQSGGGQQLGTLTLEGFTLYCVDTNDYIRKKDNSIGHTIKGETDPVSAEQNTTKRVALDWTEDFGELSSGTYILDVTVLDVYDRNAVHPLIVKHQASQNHRIEFAIP